MNRLRSLLALTALLLAPPALAQQTVPELYQASYDLEAATQYEAALERLAQLPAPEQRGYLFNLRRGWLFYLAGRHIEAISAYEVAVRLAPEAVEPRLGLMLPLMALRRWQDTERQAGEVLGRDPGSYLAQSRRAYALYNLGRFPEAEAAYRRVLAAYPSDAEMRAGLGWSLLKQGKKDDAAATFAALLRSSPRHASALAGVAALR